MKNLEKLRKKIILQDDIQSTLKLIRETNRQIVFTNGCFDILHYGHIDYLAKARELGDLLVLGLNSDKSTSRLKGPSRPINSENERAALLAALFFVDFIVIFDEDTPLNLIKKIKPNVLVKGGDYELSQIVGGEYIIAQGGRLTTIPFVNGFSTTNIINKSKGQ
ncbi:MAG: rfaE bifunctional protein nucleotidyltransferase chain/domain [Sphingobacteriales bacterium]|jgi:rfaE bifunctional protein nucleotidyltransferase chain/domain